MHSLLQQLIKIFEFDQKSETEFVGNHLDFGLSHVFGGQVAAQALMAASKTVPEKQPHSLHGYFLRPGSLDVPIHYHVDILRNGRSFSARRVVARQKNKAIFHVSVSFQKPEKGLEHQLSMPQVPLPDTLMPGDEQRLLIADKVPTQFKRLMTMPRPIDYRWVNRDEVHNTHSRSPERAAWFKTVSTLPDDPILHVCLFVYASDYGILETALLPHGITYLQNDVFVASIDHSVWMHKPFRIDEWLLHVMESPNVSGGRGFSQGRIFTSSGDYVASIAQEGLIRTAR